MAKDEIIFVDGMKVKQKFDGLLGVSINLEYFKKFMDAHAKNGYLNIDICKSRDKGTWYPRLNTWKPEQKNPQGMTPEVPDEVIPF